MAKYWTYAEIKTKIQRDTDTEAEDFIQSDELLGLVNEAIDTCEATIHKLGMEDDYFLKYENLTMAVGQERLDLPSDIYAFKIRGLQYEKGTIRYQVRRIRGRAVFQKISNIQYYNTTDNFYQYTVVNDAQATAAQILLLPSSKEDSTTSLKLWYIRNVNEMIDDTSVCDIPEFVHYVIKRVKYKIFAKEGHPLMQDAQMEMEKEERRMVDTLSNMVPDEDSTIEPDLSHYGDMSDIGFNN